jgi:CRP-like cAMP-binding protein
MRMHRDSKARLIRSLPLFSECDGREIAQVAAIADELVLPEGKVLAQESADGQEFVVLVTGTAEVVRDGKTIAELGPGDFFGEIAVLTGRPRMASVVATSPVDALVIEGHAFLHLLESAPGIREKVQRAVVDRLTAAS